MKSKYCIGLAVAAVMFGACGSETADSGIDQADDINKEQKKAADASGAYAADNGTSKFLVRAFSNGKGIEKMSELGKAKARSESLRKMIADIGMEHARINNEIQTLANERQIKLPDAIGGEMQRPLERAGNASANDFDKIFIEELKEMLDESENEFEDGVEEAKDGAVQRFASDYRPKLKRMQDSLQILQKNIR